jgi:hypothetical protein
VSSYGQLHTLIGDYSTSSTCIIPSAEVPIAANLTAGIFDGHESLNSAGIEDATEEWEMPELKTMKCGDSVASAITAVSFLSRPTLTRNATHGSNMNGITIFPNDDTAKSQEFEGVSASDYQDDPGGLPREVSVLRTTPTPWSVLEANHGTGDETKQPTRAPHPLVFPAQIRSPSQSR